MKYKMLTLTLSGLLMAFSSSYLLARGGGEGHDGGRGGGHEGRGNDGGKGRSDRSEQLYNKGDAYEEIMGPRKKQNEVVNKKARKKPPLKQPRNPNAAIPAVPSKKGDSPVY